MKKITALIERLQNMSGYENKSELMQEDTDRIIYCVYGLDNCLELVNALREMHNSDEASRIINFDFGRTLIPSVWAIIAK